MYHISHNELSLCTFFKRNMNYMQDMITDEMDDVNYEVIDVSQYFE